jgi:hypothetical protein
MQVNSDCRPMLLICNSQRAFGMLKSNIVKPHNGIHMLRSAAVAFTAEGRLLGFDTGDWSMLLGGFFLAGLLALMV